MATRQRHIVETVAARDALVKRLREELEDGGSNHTFTQAQRNDASHAYDLLAKEGVTDSLTEAVTYMLRHKYPAGGQMTLGKLVDEFVGKKRLATRKISKEDTQPKYTPVYLRSLHRFEQLAETLGQRWLHDIKPVEIEDWLYSRPLGEYSLLQYYNYLKMLFRYATKREYMHRDIMFQVRRPDPKKFDPVILTIEEAGALLKSAWEELEGVCFTYVVIGLFCGVRPHELCRLRWEDLREGGTVIRLPASKSKTNDMRVIPLPLNARLLLRAWIDKTYKESVDVAEPTPTDKIVPLEYDKLRREFYRIYRRAGIKRWPKDAMRHSFATYYYQATQSMISLQLRMGHSTPKTSLKHYLNLTDQPWERYFTLGTEGVRKPLEEVLEACKIELPWADSSVPVTYDKPQLCKMLYLC
jgi:integrase